MQYPDGAYRTYRPAGYNWADWSERPCGSDGACWYYWANRSNWRVRGGWNNRAYRPLGCNWFGRRNRANWPCGSSWYYRSDWWARPEWASRPDWQHRAYGWNGTKWT